MSTRNLLDSWAKIAPKEYDSASISWDRILPNDREMKVLVSDLLDLIVEKRIDIHLEYNTPDICKVTLRLHKVAVAEKPDFYQALLYAYVSLLAQEREVKVGRWKHYKGGEYEVKINGITTWKTPPRQRSQNERSHPYSLEENPDVHLFRYGSFYFSDNDYDLSLDDDACDYGDRVFYAGVTGRWARAVDDFLGLTEDGRLRFEYLGEGA